MVCFSVAQFIHQNGYLTVLITVAFAGELGLIAGAALARTGAVTLTGVVILGTVASFVANMFYYYAGKLLWNKWRFLRDRLGDKVERSSRVVNRYGSPMMLAARFFYGVRDIIPVALGLYRVKTGLFVLYNIIGAFIWAFLFTVLGNVLSGFMKESFGSIQSMLVWGIAAAIFVAVAYSLIRKTVSKLN